MREPQIRDFRKLALYQKGMVWIEEIREIVKGWSWEDKQVIGHQLLRSSSSVIANLVEGNGQLYLQKEINFINNALGSAAESMMWFETAYKAGLMNQATFKRLDSEAIELRKMLVAMMKKIRVEIVDRKLA
ncbi:four helix bundle protein [Paenibacillus sp. F411]|uniref:four helix bundle protein n=1 Tax=Paenibacillus sp. F411 TaxID=2820239 RepID=UPI001AAF3174|nr:four helix bundle protein [Paenibacillus sp. F411]MBO2945623.1 four helix bundle protein [Paenibacillus sp. F411]